jgi:hypothetical protein
MGRFICPSSLSGLFDGCHNKKQCSEFFMINFKNK